MLFVAETSRESAVVVSVWMA